MNENEIRPCIFAGRCARLCSPERDINISSECYMTTISDRQVRNISDCKVKEDGTIAISYWTYDVGIGVLHELVALMAQEKAITFRQIHYICTNEQPGPVTSTWPLVWNGLVQIDDDKLTFEFIEKRDTDD